MIRYLYEIKHNSVKLLICFVNTIKKKIVLSTKNIKSNLLKGLYNFHSTRSIGYFHIFEFDI